MKGGKISLANKSPINKLLTPGQHRVDCSGARASDIDTEKERKRERER